MTEAQAPTNGQVDLDLDAPAEGKPNVRHRAFKLRGEHFNVPHVNIGLFGDAVQELDDAETVEGVKLVEVWQAQADFISASIHPDDLGRFNTIRERPVDSLSPSDLRRLYSYLWEVHTGRPTKSVEASGPGPESSEASSKAGSGQPVVVRPT